MQEEEYCLRQLDIRAAEQAKALFAGVFTQEPWNDDWSDQKQLEAYMQDLMGQNNSLSFGLYKGAKLVALSMGRVKHWYEGTEYCIDELCVGASYQGKGVGRLFVREIEKACRALGLTHIFLLTDKDVPAFAFYQKQGFCHLENNAAFAKALG
ncbi:MAG: GNAT family N-acetyltransferase [Acutalibacter sp.]|nr:GNAT family N-acetyltransferase [Acutalibacter sp.]